MIGIRTGSRFEGGARFEVSVSIRRVKPGDAEAVAELNAALGYPATVDEVREWIAALAGCEAGRAVFVACVEDEVAGWVDVAIACCTRDIAQHAGGCSSLLSSRWVF